MSESDGFLALTDQWRWRRSVVFIFEYNLTLDLALFQLIKIHALRGRFSIDEIKNSFKMKCSCCIFSMRRGVGTI